MTKNNKVVIYQAKNGAIELKKDSNMETVWASQAQISEIFEIDRSVATKHIRNIFKDKELKESSVCAKFAHTAADGKTYQTSFYNLDIILAVGYRANSSRAISFRQWATKTLRSHIVEGYTINPARIARNYQTFLRAIEDVKKLAGKSAAVGASEILDLVKTFASTWFSLAAYDKSALPIAGANKKQVKIAAEDLTKAIEAFKQDLVAKRQTTELFSQEKSKGSLSGIFGNVFQSFGGQDLYPTIEEKASHLLYFIIKNHPFNDGNKRCGAFTFVWFLQKAKVLNIQKITPEALTALTLLIAESNPKEKERIVGLVLLLLKK